MTQDGLAAEGTSTHGPRRPAIPADRDLTLDLVRVACVVLVVFVHILFTGVGQAPDGSLVIEKTVEEQSWFAPATWIADIMPLFFVVGGFAARAGWRSAQRRGEGAAEFVRLRLARLARPAVPLFVFYVVTLGAAQLLGIDPALVDTIAIGVGSPLWFLGAYLIVQALAPWMISLHTRFGPRVLLVLLAGAVLTDVLRIVVVGEWLGVGALPSTGYGFGQELFGIPNAAFVWLFAQQIGFAFYDGWFRSRRLGELIAIVVVGYGVVAAEIAVGGHSWDMLANQWPPTTPLALLAVVQAAALAVLHRPLTALMRTRVAQGAVLLIGSRLMTVYLWHLPVTIILIGIQLLLPFPMPYPGSAAWWWTRLPFLIVVIAAVCALSLWLVRFEKAPTMGATPSAGRTALACVVFIIPMLAITAYGLDLPLAAAALLGSLAALLLAGAKVAGIRIRD